MLKPDASGIPNPIGLPLPVFEAWLESAEVRPEQGPTEVALVVLRHQLAVCVFREAGTRLGEDIEELHDMRVAMRRMRSALRLFRDHVPPDIRALDSELRWMGGVLGPVRDLDVQIEQIETWRHEVPEGDAPALDVLGRRLGESRHEARLLMLREMDSERFVGSLRRMVELLDTAPATHGRTLEIRDVAPELIERQFRRVVKKGTSLTADSPAAEFHRLRVRCKGLRYAIEFHRDLYPKRARSMIRHMKALQDLLGDHQDADVAVEQLRAFLRLDPPLPAATVFVMGALSERYSRAAAEHRRALPALFEGLTDRHWKRLRRAMRKLRSHRGPPK